MMMRVSRDFVIKALPAGAYPCEAVPDGFQRAAAEVAEPPMGERNLHHKHCDAHEETARVAAHRV